MRICILLLSFCGLMAAQDVKLRGGNVLSSETYSFRQPLLANKLDVFAIPEIYKQAGIPGISFNERYFASRDQAYIARLRAAVVKAGRVVVALQVDGNLAIADEAKRKEQIEHNKQSLRIAHDLGAPVMRVNTGGTSKEESADSTVGLDRVIAALREMLPEARRLKVKIAIENHGGVSATADNILKMIKATDPKYVGALLDFGNFQGDGRYDDISKLAPYALSTHVKVGKLDGRGEVTEYDLPRVLGILKKSGFKGSLSIEYIGPLEPAEGVRVGRDLIRKHW